MLSVISVDMDDFNILQKQKRGIIDALLLIVKYKV